MAPPKSTLTGEKVASRTLDFQTGEPLLCAEMLSTRRAMRYPENANQMSQENATMAFVSEQKPCHQSGSNREKSPEQTWLTSLRSFEESAADESHKTQRTPNQTSSTRIMDVIAPRRSTSMNHRAGILVHVITETATAKASKV